ncbi:hypothetical protein EIK79_04520 [Halocatena pleomorpha]|uniref:DUF7973 domain-containing protein n=1 Tax=Halocatena pleomorpha TaxID=1785090 RepID=A0A3P3RJD5_9EURY|nr:hypothetical protein EIK79_04520 [Halocatena pleomorpha]
MSALSDPGLWLAAFAGGAFGAALGALPAFAFMGIIVIAGETANVVTEAVGVEAQIAITDSIAFGPVFGPHISFAGGAAAAAYAARKGYMDTGFDYHEAKNISHALGTRYDVLAVGGVFGVFGMIVRQTSGGLGMPWDPIAMGVVISAVAHRLIFGYSLIGSVHVDSLWDMTPFESEEMHTTAEGGEIVADGGETAEKAATDREDGSQRLVVEPWLPQQYRWGNVAMLGLVVGLLGGYLVVVTGSVFLGFGISAATLFFLACGVEQIPVTHHITLPASTAAVALAGGTTDMAMLPALAIAAVFGLSGALSGEIVQRVFYAHGDTHFDPPAAAIALNTFFIAVLYYVGLFPGFSWLPL